MKLKHYGETMTEQTIIELVNPETNILAFKLITLNDDSYFKSLESYNCYKVILIRRGKGKIAFDNVMYEFSDNCLIRFPIYQPFRIEADGPVDGILLQFHPDFFWNHKYDMEITSKQVLFTGIGEKPSIKITKAEMGQLLLPLDNLISELHNDDLGRYDITVSWVKIFMVYASRMKLKKGVVYAEALSTVYYTFRKLTNAIEQHFHRKHRPADYAKLLNITVKTLNRAAKHQLGKTVSDMISDRIITQAKHELYLSDKPIKQIAFELGFHDISYFSRFFKVRMDMSPESYRKSVREDTE
ncbi:helix-turn-helix domain-containing protein [Sphingobacterium arenae]|uniref:AraC family transcriptional regulator n=1 Tax=Sphingobacterium arenae TaxID=1280598 RepID=A0ABR7XY70_9SPHI|nr:helix-turn-helix domain-containing protein [Sphingobacterium arenae]MBD1423972.1 AraC family transcriptional regulator [Sphingobacterium arenae]